MRRLESDCEHDGEFGAEEKGFPRQGLSPFHKWGILSAQSRAFSAHGYVTEKHSRDLTLSSLWSLAFGMSFSCGRGARESETWFPSNSSRHSYSCHEISRFCGVGERRSEVGGGFINPLCTIAFLYVCMYILLMIPESQTKQTVHAPFHCTFANRKREGKNLITKSRLLCAVLSLSIWYFGGPVFGARI